MDVVVSEQGGLSMTRGVEEEIYLGIFCVTYLGRSMSTGHSLLRGRGRHSARGEQRTSQLYFSLHSWL